MPSTTWMARPSMRRVLLVGLSLGLAGCQAPSERAAVVSSKLTLSPAADGKVTVSGTAGAVIGHPYGVTFTLRREGGITAYRSQHLSGEGLPIVSGFALVSSDGSFPATTLGDAQNAIKSGDELNVRPIRRSVQEGGSVQLSDAGENVALPVP